MGRCLVLIIKSSLFLKVRDSRNEFQKPWFRVSQLSKLNTYTSGTGQKSTGDTLAHSDTLARSDILVQNLYCNYFSMLR